MSLHADALALLEGWAAPTPPQDALRQRFVAHLRAHPDGERRGCVPDHLTASTLVLSPDARWVLLTLHAKARRWFQLGGHCEDADTTLAAAAHREAAEESGLAALALDRRPVQLSEHAVPFCGGTGGVHHLDVRFVAVAPHGPEAEGHAVSEESLDVRWWPVDALPDPEPELVELVALARSRLASSRSASSRSAPSRSAPSRSAPSRSAPSRSAPSRSAQSTSAATGPPASPGTSGSPSPSASLAGGSTSAAADQPSR